MTVPAVPELAKLLILITSLLVRRCPRCIKRTVECKESTRGWHWRALVSLVPADEMWSGPWQWSGSDPEPLDRLPRHATEQRALPLRMCNYCSTYLAELAIAAARALIGRCRWSPLAPTTPSQPKPASPPVHARGNWGVPAPRTRRCACMHGLKSH